VNRSRGDRERTVIAEEGDTGEKSASKLRGRDLLDGFVDARTAYGSEWT